MQIRKISLPLAIAICSLTACVSGRGKGGDDQKLEVQFIQVNDVYEIAPLSGGKEGGIARIATLKKQEVQRNPNTFLVMAGDFLSPSVYNSLQYNGKAVRGKQMIDALNAAGLDFAAFGNHEFDIREGELQERLDESKFQWISSNVQHKTKTGLVPFLQSGRIIPQTYILNLSDADGTKAKLGIISVTLPFNRADYVQYTDPLATAKEKYNALKDSVDVVIALTHQVEMEDRELSAAIPAIPLIMGGHEHDNRFVELDKAYITKAHANAKSAYVTSITIDKKGKKVKATPRLVYLDGSIALDSATSVVVNKWTAIAEQNFSSLGFNARRIVLDKGEALDGREAVVRSQPTNLTKKIVKAMEWAAPRAQVALMNSGSVRVDDVLAPPITEYDIIRTLPFGGGVREVEMKGSMLSQVLITGEKNRGIGGYLIYSDALRLQGGNWYLNGEPLAAEKIYRVALTEFLLTGKEANLDFLLPTNPGIIKVHEAPAKDSPLYDIRQTLIRFLSTQ